MVYEESLLWRLIGAHFELLCAHTSIIFRYFAVANIYNECVYVAGSRGFKNVVVIVCGGSAVSLDLLNKWRKDFAV